MLGDLFDAWIGDDQLREPLAGRVASALRDVAAAGVPVGIIVGNRDFLLGERFAGAAGATLLPEQIVVDVAGTPTLLLHGDELCTSDVGVPAVPRDRARSAVAARAFSRCPMRCAAASRAGCGGKSRDGDRRQAGSDHWTSSRRAVEAAFRAADVSRMIHGHTHRPAHHHLVVDGRACERWVLADWYDRGSYLEFDADGGRARDLPAAA